ncbi:radical SAM protein [bacterium]|nr:radical SAM protein [candidate division CSSED10-310 bacterium]
MDDVVARLISWSRGEPRGPFNVELNPTDLCNLRCCFCGTLEKKKAENWDYSDEMSKERQLDLTREGITLGVRAWRISGGGEAMVHAGTVLDMMTLIKQSGGWGDLTTNGTLFKGDAIERIVDLGWNSVEFSIDGADARTHDKLRGRWRTFRKAIQAMERFQAVKQARGAALPEIHWKSILMAPNYRQVPDMVRLAASLGCAKFILEPIAPCTPDGPALKLSRGQTMDFQAFLEHAIAIADDAGLRHNLADLREVDLIAKDDLDTRLVEQERAVDHNLLPVVCFQPWYNMVVRPNGDVSPCCVFFSRGREAAGSGLHEVWHGEYFSGLRYRILIGELPPECATCHIEHIHKNRAMREEILNRLSENEREVVYERWIESARRATGGEG